MVEFYNYFMLMLIVASLATSTLISLRFINISEFKNGYVDLIKVLMSGSMVYTTMSVSYNFVGNIAHEYLLAILTYFLISKRQAFFLTLITPLFALLFIFFIDDSLSLRIIIMCFAFGLFVFLLMSVTAYLIPNQLLAIIVCEILAVTTKLWFASDIPLMAVQSGSELFELTQSLYRVGVGIAVLIIVRQLYLQVVKLQYQNKKLYQNSYHDNLTGLFNYRKLEKDLSWYSQDNDNLGIAIFDLDYFKQINDEFGHLNGNQLLQHFSEFLSEYLQYKNGNEPLNLYRYGGEEFVWIFDASHIGDLALFFESLQRQLKTMPWDEIDGRTISFSGGVGLLRHHHDLSSVLRSADELLYQAKANGRAQTTIEAK